MAYTTTHTQAGSVLGSIRNFFAPVWHTLMLVAESNYRMRRVEDLRALSDAQLAKRGLKREDIIRHAFLDAV